MLNIVWTPAAIQDLKESFDYISLDDPKAAERVAAKIHEASQMLQELPSLGRKGRYKDMYEWVLSKLPYSIWYRVNSQKQVLEIVRVLHDARKKP